MPHLLPRRPPAFPTTPTTHREREKLLRRAEADKARAGESEQLEGKVVVLEAELERMLAHVQESTAAMREAQAQRQSQAAELAAHEAARKEAEEDAAATRLALHDVVRRVSALTQAMLPSYEPRTSPAARDDATRGELLHGLSDGVDFLGEVFRARAEAATLIRERMKTDHLELQAKLSVAAHQQSVLEEGMRMSEDNVGSERRMMAERQEGADAKHKAELARLEADLGCALRDLQESRVAGERLRLAQEAASDELATTAAAAAAADERCAKEAAARRHLQEVVADERARCAVAEKQVAELTMQMKLCGMGATPTLRERELLDMVERLSGRRGELEAECCNLRDRLGCGGSTGDAGEEEVVEGGVMVAVAAAAAGTGEVGGTESLDAHLIGLHGEDDGVDVALAEVLLERRLAARQEKSAGSLLN